MPPRLFSRYMFTRAVTDDAGRLYLTEREPYAFRAFGDNGQHVVKEGDSLFSLAARYFKGFDRPAGLWWILADFQPDPIHDPTIALAPGRVLVIPSMRTVQEEIFSERRRDVT